MGLLKALLLPLQLWNDHVLAAGRWVSIVAVALMVLAILIQVFFRYVLNNALPWPDEAARFLMLWMTGLMAPVAYRRGGFVAIEMLCHALPARAGAALSLALLVLSLGVLAVAVQIGWGEVTGFGGRFATSSLWIWMPDGWMKVPKAWMMASLLVGVVLLLIVNFELILRALISMLGGADDLRPIPMGETEIMAE
jgi:TRAP-type C4-dicarboxylate transport system permease small subunit